MSYPKWRHHPEKESVIVQSPEEESYMAPDDQGWSDNREFTHDEPVETGPVEVDESVEGGPLEP